MKKKANLLLSHFDKNHSYNEHFSSIFATSSFSFFWIQSEIFWVSEDYNVKKNKKTFILSLALSLPVNIVHYNVLSSLKLWSLCSLCAVFDTVFLIKPSECPQLCQKSSIKVKSASFVHAQSVKVWFCSWQVEWYLLLGTKGYVKLKKKKTWSTTYIVLLAHNWIELNISLTLERM